VLEIKIERLRKLQTKVESNVRKEVDALVHRNGRHEEGSLILMPARDWRISTSTCRGKSR